MTFPPLKEIPHCSGPHQPSMMQWLRNLVQPRPRKVDQREIRRKWLARQPRPNDADMREARAMWRDGFDSHEIASELGFPEVFIYNRLYGVSDVYPDGLEAAS